MSKTLQKRGEHFVEIESTPVNENFKKSLFTDEQGDNVYHALVKLEGYNVYVREMSNTALEAYIAAESMLERRARAVTSKATADMSDAVRRQIEAETKDILKKQEEMALALLIGAVIGWDLPREFGMEALGKLTKQARNKLLANVVHTAGLGKSEADFLEKTS